LKEYCVMKFGGSCLRGIDGIRDIVSIASSNEKCVLVVSAISGITDAILTFITGRLSERKIEDFVSSLREKHNELIEKLSPPGVHSRYTQEVNRITRKFGRLLYGVYYTGELTPRTHALLLSFGERLSARVIAAALEGAGCRSIVFDSDSLAIVTDGGYENANADLELTRKRARRKLREAVDQGLCPVVTGFFGVNREGHVTLLGRNGTDYSSAVICYAIGSRDLVIWKDVDGFMSADPTLVPEARLISELSYDEASELSYFGANVLHPKAVEPAKAGGIVIRIKNISTPGSEGTSITGSRRRTQGVVKSVSCLKDLAIIRTYVASGGYQSGTISRISGHMGRAGVNIISATTSQTCIAFLIREADLKKATASLRALIRGELDKMETEKDVALLCAVGEGLGTTRGIAAKVFTAISERGVNVGMMSAGASSAAYHFTVSMKDLETAARAVHLVFFGGEG